MKFFGIIYLETETTAQEREEKDMMMFYGDKETVRLAQTCPFCGKQYEGIFFTAEYEKWRNGALIQDAMPTASATAREWLISGICPECQERVFGEEE